MAKKKDLGKSKMEWTVDGERYTSYVLERSQYDNKSTHIIVARHNHEVKVKNIEKFFFDYHKKVSVSSFAFHASIISLVVMAFLVVPFIHSGALNVFAGAIPFIIASLTATVGYSVRKKITESKKVVIDGHDVEFAEVHDYGMSAYNERKWIRAIASDFGSGIVVKNFIDGRRHSLIGNYDYAIIRSKMENNPNAKAIKSEIDEMFEYFGSDEHHSKDVYEREDEKEVAFRHLEAIKEDMKEHESEISYKPFVVPSITSKKSVKIEDPRFVVGNVKDKIGALRSDISWVIENPSFFDSYSSISAELFEKLSEWDDLGLKSGVTDKDRAELAKTIDTLFSESKLAAEKIGMDHLHGETKARAMRASKLVRKAESTNAEDERNSLMAKAAELLAGIMDTILPKQSVEALESYRIAAITETLEQESLLVSVEEYDKVLTHSQSL